MRARIFQRPKTSMQSGLAHTGGWVLDFQPAEREVNDPLMGWWGSGDTLGSVRLAFDTPEDAKAYADKHGITYDFDPAPASRPVKPRAYADNFRYGRADNWTH